MNGTGSGAGWRAAPLYFRRFGAVDGSGRPDGAERAILAAVAQGIHFVR
jgi:hypothetical protein